MSSVVLHPLIHQYRKDTLKFGLNFRNSKSSSVCCSPRLHSNAVRFCNSKPSRPPAFKATSSTDTSLVETSEPADVFFARTFPLKRTHKLEGKILIRLDNGKDEDNWHLTVGCTLPGKWILHWGVHYVNDVGSEWDQPPLEMRPPDSISIKDYAIETPLKQSSAALEGDILHEVKIDFNTNSSIAAINFVLKDQETGAWFQHRGRDFKVPLIDYLHDDDNIVGAKKGFGIWPVGQLSNVLKVEDRSDDLGEYNPKKNLLQGFNAEHSIVKETVFENTVSVSVRRCPDTSNNLLTIETDIPSDVVVHWGVCKDEAKKWEIPAEPYPDETLVYKDKALRTLLQRKGGNGAWGSFTLSKELKGFLFVLKLNEHTWLNCNGDDFYIPLSSSNQETESSVSEEKPVSSQDQESSSYTDEIISELRDLVKDISSEKSRGTKSKEAQEVILQEIEKLAAEAYSIFRSSVPAFPETAVAEIDAVEPAVKICSGTGTGFEILCQGFNWESNKSRRWYLELQEKAEELSKLGFTVVWLPPPTESVSPEGYMPKDLYNLNSRYGSIDELKALVKKFHEVGIKVLGDAVLNHRCAHDKNQNGIWNIFGGRLNWDDRAVVADDPHFQGRGNKSSGENFHAAPNIDHSQDFVRKDLKEWLCWMREEIGYDGWRLDFVRGFWGGYVKDYMDASEPYFAVGEYWDSLSYKYGEMEHNQDAHRQRIVDWISATSGTAGAFDVTTKGILHATLERCEYWRLSDQKGKPPGVVGWWPSRAVTFIENHDTGSTQGHWRFPEGKEMQGYAYILTHPGTPSVFYDHIFSHYQSEISSLISIRNRNKIHCRSTVQITKAEKDVYAAIVDEKVAMKIGPGHYEPPSGSQKWSLALDGRDYKVWESS